MRDVKDFKESGIAPFGQLPVMEVDGTLVAQTGAIARYCGKQGGFYPRDDDLAAAKIDEIIDTATDITMAIGKSMRMEEAEKKAARVVLNNETLPGFFKALEKIMTENGSSGRDLQIYHSYDAKLFQASMWGAA